ncbi:hypothetical protein [Nostoc sp. UHCC 0252]|uniref:hypothetical protein n=1 Tax=Nostoc sp. UHCC 0252 TaxID=3110241 RepID=UPI002B21604E|nr:hypothetical protein [Nostoc sp. UHCC 0252]MEA5603224.1 hypothetical protein [Nostoc sp. UHCC 0252]
MNSMHSDIEIEILLLGKWRFNTDSEKITIEFKDDMTYEQTRIQTLLFSKPKELLTGNKFTGVSLFCHFPSILNKRIKIKNSGR